MSSLAKHPPLVLRAAPGESYGPRAGTPTLAIAPGRESISVLVCCGKGQAKRCRGRALSHRIPLAGLKCVSEKRRGQIDLLLLRLWESGNPAGFAGFPSPRALRASFPQPCEAPKLKSSRHGCLRPLFRSVT